MKQFDIFVIFFLLFGNVFTAASQGNVTQDSIFYYYNGEKIYIPQNKSFVVVYYNDSTTIFTNETISITKASVEEDVVVDSATNSHRILVNLGEGDYVTAINDLKKNTKIIDIEPVVGIDRITKLSRLFYVKLKADSDYSKLFSTSNLNKVAIVGSVPYCDRWYELEVSKNSAGNSIEMANRFWETGLFEKIDPGFLLDFKPNIDTCVTDSSFISQWGMQSIHACEAWNLTTGSPNVKVAVIDQGVDENHREMSHVNTSFSHDMMWGTNHARLYHTDELFYHGIHVGGIIFANHNANRIAGVAPNVSLINISHNLKANNDYQVSKLASAIRLAVQEGANIINNSWGDHGGYFQLLHSHLIEEAIDEAIINNCLMIFSSGNFAPLMDYPATYREEILTVGAVTSNLSRWIYSGNGDELDIVAPGVSIYSTHNDNGYISFSGTSMATPHVSGVAALMLSINPQLTASDIRYIIENTANKVGNCIYLTYPTHHSGNWNPDMGYGLVDAHKAVVHALEYGHDNITGSSNIADCETKDYQCDFLHPEIFTYNWSASSNLGIVEDRGKSVTVTPLSVGTGTISVDVYQQDRLMYTLTKTITVTSAWNEYTPVATTTLHITSDTTWSSENYIPLHVTVDSNATLTITGTYHCGQATRLIVRPGGKLVVDGGTLTSACPNEMWQGIEVVGDRTKRQLQKFQGTVELRNGAVIENALCGIYTGLHGDTVYATTGGIISATNTIFKNNRQSVMINSYAYTTPSGSIANYNSTFSRCTFTKDNNNLFAANNTAFAEHVRLWDVKGVTFEGCTFNDLTSSALGKGRGIYAADAGVLVNTYCPPQPTSVCECPETDATYSFFSGFTTAVEVNTSGNPYAVRTDEVRFSNNSTGVSIYGNHFATVTRCQFNLDQWPVSSKGNIGLYLNGCSGYTVEENTFMRTFYPTSPLTTDNSTGICVSTSGITTNSLYRNVFEKLTKGIHVIGINGSGTTGLRMTCNDFSNGKYDIHIAAKANVAHNQGTAVKGADNIFVSTITSSIFNESMDVINYYYGNGSAPISPYQVTTHSGAAANLCASTLCDGGGTPKSLAEFQSDMDACTGSTQPLSDTYYAAVRTLMSDTMLDLNELEMWHTAAQPIADPYSLTETRFMKGYAEIFAENAEDAEMANYADFHAMKLALRDIDADNDVAVGANDYSPLQPGGHINWYALTPAQIAELQTIAERNTGRASVMAKGVLCFFHGICYEDEWDDAGVFDTPLQDSDTTGTRAKHTAMGIDNDATLSVYPNPTDDLLFIELSGGAGIANVALYDLQGRFVTGVFNTPQQGGTATINVKSIPAGVYVLRVSDANGKAYHQKIVRK